MATDQSTILCVIGVFIAIFFVAYSWNMQNRCEKYGGPVKKLRRIPKEDCYAICGQYYNHCMAPYYQGRYIDAGACQRRRNNCIAVCNYSDFHRL